MGDDLNFAQKFTRTAADGLAHLVEMEDPRAAGDAAVVIDLMTTVQRGAKRLRARHIYTGAQGVLSALHHETDAVLQGRIETLGLVVTEYARGLDQLLPNQVPAEAKTPSDKWDAARETLNALLPVASSEDADMLSRLMRAPVTLETVHPDETAETTIDEEAPIISDDTASANVVPEKVVRSLKYSAEPAPMVTLDAMMRDVIADALSVARSIGRTISLSYDMGNKDISDKQAENLRTRLGQALSQIIRQSMTEDRMGHIDINLAGEQLHVVAGTTAMRVPIDPKKPSQPKPKRLITSETEPGLRSQLNALMDPISLHETAS